MGPEFGILGPLEVVDGGRRLALGGSKQRRLLATLLVHLGAVVSVDRLVEAVWDGDAPASAETTLRTHVSHLRRSLAAARAQDLVVTRAPGYALDLAPERLDARRFERLVEGGRAALDRGDAGPAAEALREALGLWRGPVLADLDRPRFAEAETARLDELFLAALEARVDADLALGRHGELVAELEALVDAHPFRERLCGQLMLALYRSGRQADALAVYRAARERLAEELGLAPGPALAELETAILRHDPALAAPHQPAAAVRGPAQTPRRPPPDALLDVVRRTPMVGRSAELERLCALWEATRQGGRRVGLVSGEAGVGKTRLLAEFATVATDEEALLLVGHCDEALLIPYHPVAEALHSSPEATRVLASAPDAVRDRLAPLVGGAASADGPAALADAESGRYALFDAVGQLLALLAGTAPVVLVVEEAERIDRASSLLLRHLVRHLPEGVLLLVCFRDPPGSRHPPLAELLAELAGRGLADRLALEPLTERELAALAAALTGEEVAPAFLRRLWSYTGGNPFYTTEVVRDLGRLEAGAAWPVPTGVRDVLRGRLRALPQPSRQVLACAAVLGRDAEFALLQAVADQPEDDVVDAVEHTLRAGVLVESGSSWAASYAFPHDLVREAVYADIPAPRRQRLHLRAAQALEAAGLRRPTAVAAAALHLRAAGSLADPTQAADLSLRAADAAGDLYAWDEAVAHAEAAMTILDRAGAPPARQAQAAVRAAGLLAKSGLDYGRAVRHLEAALDHYHAAGDAVAAATVRTRLGGVLAMHSSVMDIPRALEQFAAAERLLEDGSAAFHLQQGRSQAAMFGLRTEEGIAAAERALDLAGHLGRPSLGVWARWGLAWHRFNRGEVAAAWALLDEAFATAHELADPFFAWGPANAAGLIANAYLLDPAAAEDWCRRALAQPRVHTLAHPHGGLLDQLVLALAATGRTAAARDAATELPPDAVSRRMLALLEGDWEDAERAWAAALDRDLAAGDRLDATLNAFWLARARWLLGRAEDAEAALRQALGHSVNGPQVPAELMVRAELARLRAGDDDADEAAAHLARCEEILAGGEDWRGQAGNVELARAAVAGARGDQADADAAHARALEVFAAYGLPWRRAEALHAWARALRAAGRASDAAAKAAAAGKVYGDLGAAQRWHTRAGARKAVG